jgi:hypothetical protein
MIADSPNTRGRVLRAGENSRPSVGQRENGSANEVSDEPGY